MRNTHYTPEMRQLLKAWGQFQGKQALFLIDPVANEYLISWNLAKDLGLKNEDTETPMETCQALNAHDGDTMKTVVLYIGKLKFDLPGFKEEVSFCIADLDGEDVILGMPWKHKVDSTIYSMKKKVDFTHKGKMYEIQAGVIEDTIAMVVSLLPLEKEGSHAEGFHDTRGKALMEERQQVVKTPSMSTGPKEHVVFEHEAVNDQGNNEQAVRHAIPPSNSYPGYFGGGSMFQEAKVGLPTGLQGYILGNVLGAMQSGMVNRMYGNRGAQPGFQGAYGNFGMLGTHFGMVGFPQQNVKNANNTGKTGDVITRMATHEIPLLKAPIDDNVAGSNLLMIMWLLRASQRSTRKVRTLQILPRFVRKDFDVEMEKSHRQAKEDSNGHRFTKKEPELRFPKGLIVAFSLEKTSAVEGGEPDKKEVPSEGSKEAESSKDASGEELVKEEQISREDIKSAFKSFGNIKYVDYSRGAVSGYLRFENPEEVKKARAAAVLAEAGGIAVKNCIATLEAVEGSAEEEYWRNIQRSQDKVRAEAGRGSRGRGGGGSRGRGGGRSFDKSRRESKLDGEREREEKSKPDESATLGKHQRFEDADSGDDAAPPSKQNKSE
ncbi:hypothetical protein L7F22_014823 [Adiantum nelumboides]|nr:hypothetical protein [Adiantum nelumboides]